ncbi:MAG: thioredoxin [Bradymonadales bacterium]|nr:thioredoxin [Bradymonadales bacterium]
MASKNVFEVTDTTFESEVLQSDLPTVVDLWAAWCGPCLAIGPTMDALADRYQGKVRVAKMNVDENPDTPTRYKVLAIPTILAFRNGEKVGEVRGAIKARIEALFEELAGD